MFSIYGMLFLALKKVLIVKFTLSQFPTPVKKSPSKISHPILNTIWKTLHEIAIIYQGIKLTYHTVGFLHLRLLDACKAHGHEDIKICDLAIIKPLFIISRNCIIQIAFPDI